MQDALPGDTDMQYLSDHFERTNADFVPQVLQYERLKTMDFSGNAKRKLVAASVPAHRETHGSSRTAF